ncbi:MAG: hypothetical protein Q8O94_04060 [bacterium]|nr:hypothetical protein [bacterium]
MLDCVLIVGEEGEELWVRHFTAPTKTEAVAKAEDFMKRILAETNGIERHDFPFKKDSGKKPKARLFHEFCRWE